MSVNERIRVLRKKCDLNQADFGKKIGVQSAAISKIENGERSVSEQMRIAICHQFNVNRAWLDSGIGDIFNAADDATLTMIDTLLKGENETAKALFYALARLSDYEWRAVGRIIDSVEAARRKKT